MFDGPVIFFFRSDIFLHGKIMLCFSISFLDILAFFDVDGKNLLHSFHKVKASHPLLPGFLIWRGSFNVQVGLQVSVVTLKEKV